MELSLQSEYLIIFSLIQDDNFLIIAKWLCHFDVRIIRDNFWKSNQLIDFPFLNDNNLRNLDIKFDKTNENSWLSSLQFCYPLNETRGLFQDFRSGKYLISLELQKIMFNTWKQEELNLSKIPDIFRVAAFQISKSWNETFGIT
jgi:hypothetical protein